ncbi:hypothetical protein [Ramlibacter sp. WS9]|nr:hypothetical protein [Ramlibacter sp. WS9]
MPSKTKLTSAAIAAKSAALPKISKDWKDAMSQFAILYEDRFTKVAA